jgi:hypothetical protein
VGQALKTLGYHHIVGIDYSEEMLKMAKYGTNTAKVCVGQQIHYSG